MDIQEFIGKLEREIEELQPGSLKPETDYRQLPEWSSMHTLILIALAETDYGVTITGDDLRSCKTVSDLFAIIQQRSGNPS